MQEMASLGFETVYNLLGGITDWQAAGYPIVVPATPPTTSTPPTTTTPPPNPSEPLECGIQVRAILLPVAELQDTSVFSIYLAVTNPTDHQINCDIPVTITQVDNESFITTYNVSVSIDAGQTSLVSYDEAIFPEASYTVSAGGVSEPLLVG